MVKQFAGRLRDVLMQFVRSRVARLCPAVAHRDERVNPGDFAPVSFMTKDIAGHSTTSIDSAIKFQTAARAPRKRS